MLAACSAPGPIMQVKKAMDSISPGERVGNSGDRMPVFARDASAWCATTGNKLVEKKEEKGRYTVLLEKGDELALVRRLFRQQGGKGENFNSF